MSSKILPASNVPKTPTNVGKFKISLGKRAKIKYKGEERYHNTLSIEYEDASDADIVQWVLFHAFTMNSSITLEAYQDSIVGDFSLLEEQSVNPIDYEDVAEHVYFLHKPKIKISYTELFDKFTAADEKTLDMVKNMLVNVIPRRSNFLTAVLNNSYWQLVIYFSVVEGILGRQDFCSEKFECPECGRVGQHYPMEGKEWMLSRLKGITGSDEAAEHYLKYIWAVWQKIRNPTAHTSRHPTARYVEPEVGQTVYDLKRTLGDYDKDTTALDALVRGMGDVARYLLLDKLYDTKTFPGISQLNVVRIQATPTPQTDSEQ